MTGAAATPATTAVTRGKCNPPLAALTRRAARLGALVRMQTHATELCVETCDDIDVATQLHDRLAAAVQVLEGGA